MSHRVEKTSARINAAAGTPADGAGFTPQGRPRHNGAMSGVEADATGAGSSADGRWWWDGETWLPAVSDDGLWRWDGTRWHPVLADVPSEPAALASAVHELAALGYRAAGAILARRRDEWTPPEQLRETAAKADDLTRRLDDLDHQGRTLGGDGGPALMGIIERLAGVEDERRRIAEEQERLRSELAHLEEQLGRQSLAPTIKEADERVAGARATEARALQLSTARAAEATAAHEQQERIAAARSAVETHTARRDEELTSLRAALTLAESDHARKLDLARTQACTRLCGDGDAVTAAAGSTTFRDETVVTPAGTAPRDATTVVVGTAEELMKAEPEAVAGVLLRADTTAVALAAALLDEDETRLFALVVAPHLAFAEQVDDASVADAYRAVAPGKRKNARDVAEWQTSRINEARESLRRARDDTAAVDAARKALSAAERRWTHDGESTRLERALDEAATESETLREARATLEKVVREITTPPAALTPVSDA